MATRTDRSLGAVIRPRRDRRLRPMAEPTTADEKSIDPEQARAAEDDLHRYIAPVVGPDDPRVFTDSGIEIEPPLRRGRRRPGPRGAARRARRATRSPAASTRACTATGSGRCASTPASRRPEDTNERYRYLIEHGSTGLSMAFDLPTQLGRDSDDPLCDGEVGRTGVPIDTIEDMRICFDADPARPGLDLDDDQRAGGGPAAALRAGRRGAGRRRPRSCAARSRTTCSRSTWRAATTSTRPSRRCG